MPEGRRRAPTLSKVAKQNDRREAILLSFAFNILSSKETIICAG